MKNRMILAGVLVVVLGGAWVGGQGQRALAGKRPMTFADLQRMKRVSDPQISPSGKWVMFSVTEVDLEENTKVNHLWVVPHGWAGRERQVTFWKEGESGGRFSPDGKKVLFISADGGGVVADLSGAWNDAAGTMGLRSS